MKNATLAKRFVLMRLSIIAASTAVGIAGQALDWSITTSLAALVLTQIILVFIALLP